MILAGLVRLGADADLRYTPDGTPVANMRAAYNYGRKGTDNKKPSQWTEFSLWGERAEKLAGYLTKGTTLDVVLEDVHIEPYPKREGGEGHKLVGRVVLLEFAGGGQRDQAGGGEKPGQQPKKPAAQAPAAGGDFDDDLPPF